MRLTTRGEVDPPEPQQRDHDKGARLYTLAAFDRAIMEQIREAYDQPVR